MRRVALIPGSLLLLCTAAVVWAGLRLPPPLWVLQYGISSGCEPTGRTREIAGVEFVEIGPGYRLVGENVAGYEPDSISGRTGRALGLPWGSVVVVSLVGLPLHWAEFPRGFWIARTVVRWGQYRRFYPEFRPWRGRSLTGPDRLRLTRPQAERYCDWLSERVGRRVRPLDAPEWYVARYAGGRPGDGAPDPPLTRPGAPNAWGLLDFGLGTGEWCIHPPTSAFGFPGGPPWSGDPGELEFAEAAGLYLRPAFVDVDP